MIKGWKKSTLGEACRIEKGKASAANETPGIYPLVTTGEKQKSAATWQFDTPAVCVPMISAFGHGKAGLKRIHYQEGKFALASILSALIVKKPDELSAKFLSMFLNFYKDQLLVPLQFGAANMSITVERLATVPIWFPSLHEQEQILSVIEEAESLRATRASANERMDKFSPALFRDIFENSKQKSKWPKTQLQKIISRITNGFVGPTRDIYQEKGIPYILSKHIKFGEVLFDNETFISDEFNKKNSKSILKIDDVLVVQTGQAGETAVVRENHIGHNCHALIVITPLSEFLIGDFLSGYFKSDYGKSQLLGLQTGAILKHLNCGDVKKMELFLPPLALQREFAARVEEARGVQSAQGKSAEKVEALYQSMLSRAFAGEL